MFVLTDIKDLNVKVKSADGQLISRRTTTVKLSIVIKRIIRLVKHTGVGSTVAVGLAFVYSNNEKLFTENFILALYS